MGQTAVGDLRSNQQNYQQCFIGHSQGAAWRETFEQVCEEVLPTFDLKPWYADKYYQGSIPLREKVVNMIATTRYGIYDLSYWRENDQSAWTMPRNVLIELGMAIALNRPMLLLRHGKNRECGLTLPASLEGIAIGEFGDGKKILRETLKTRLPSLTQRTPKQDWLNRYCHFGGLECAYREVHPQAQQWGRQKIHIHVSDGTNSDHTDCTDFHDMIEEEVIARFSNLEFNYLDSLTCPQEHKFLLCSRCQEVRTSPFAIYRITPHTSADTFIAIGMSIALEKQFKYPITKILVTDDKKNIPSLLEGYEMIVERNYARMKDRLNSILPEMIEKTRQTTWKPRPLPFEVFLPQMETSPAEMKAESTIEKIDDLLPESEETSTVYSDRTEEKAQETNIIQKPVNIFICYAHQDETFCRELEQHLETLKYEGLIDLWHERLIQPGIVWEEERSIHLDASQIVLMLISPDFMYSDYINGIEMVETIERAERGETHVIPIILRPADWQNAPFGKLPILPKNRKSVTEQINREQTFIALANDIRRTILTGKVPRRKNRKRGRRGSKKSKEQMDSILTQ